MAALSGLVIWVVAQQRQEDPSPPEKERLGEPDESSAVRARRELDRLAILEPAAFEAELRRLKTPQEIAADHAAAFAIVQPVEASAEAERSKEPAFRAVQALARAAILDPVSHSGSPEELNRQHALRKAAGQKEEDDILEPEFDSTNIPQLPLLKEPQRRR